MIIAIDIDDTLVTTTASVLAQHYADTGELVDINDVRTYRIEDYISEEYKDDFYKIFLKKEMWKRIKLLPNCVEAIKRLHEKQHQIYFCTSTEPQNIAKKFSFLRRTFPFINVRKALINTPNKQLIHFDVLIDDAVHNVVDAPYYSILFSQPWNENFDDAEHDNIYRVNDWTQVEAMVDIIERIKNGD